MILTVIIVVSVMLVLSAFFSGMEIAFVASNKLKIEIEKRSNPIFSYILGVFTREPGQYITTMLVGNNISLVIYSMYMSTLINTIGQATGVELLQGSILLETIISTIIIIFTAEFIPKALVRLSPNFYLKAFAVPAYLFYLLLYPLAKISTWISVGIMRVFGVKISSEQNIRRFDKVDLAYLIDEVTENETAEHKTDNEIKLFQNALDFSNISVRDCMVPRIDIEAVDVAHSLEEITQRFIDSQYSRIFVYDGSIDNIVGYVNTKSLFTEPSTIKELIRKVDFVPESMPAQNLLSKLIRKNRSVAVVIDEFGGTAGIVSLEDVLEEIFGEIEDEHDTPELIETKVSQSEYIFSCRLEVHYLNVKYGLNIPESEEYDTLAGFIIHHYEGIPSKDEVIVIEKIRVKIIKISSSRIDLAQIDILD